MWIIILLGVLFIAALILGTGILSRIKGSAEAPQILPVQASPDDNYVVYINWDGFAWYYYELANKEGKSRTPVINSLIKNGVLFSNCYTGIPSITNPMQCAIVSGAWPETTGNCYMYYNKESNKVLQTGRDNKAETIGEAAVRQGLKIASVQQFILQDRGAVEGDEDRPYIQYENADYSKRFDSAIKLIRGEPDGSGNQRVQLKEIPKFIAIYMDDLDGIGHNGGITYGLFPVSTEKDRLNSIVKRLEEMDKKLGEFIDACRERGIYDNMSFVLTSDHGMAPYGQQDKDDNKFGYSSLQDLTDTIKSLGYKVEVLSKGQSPKPDTDIVLVTGGLEVQLSFTHEYSNDDMSNIVAAVRDKEYTGKIMDKEGLKERGAMDGFADLLISSKPPYSFKMERGFSKARGQHDSLDDTAQHIFSIMWGKGIRKGYTYESRMYNIDFARTMTELLGIDGPSDATGRILEDALEIH